MPYNGWSNYETWNVMLWIDNDENSQYEFESMCQKAKNIHELADSIKTWFCEQAPDLGASCWADLLGAALDSVDWREIAEHGWGDYHEEEEDEEEEKPEEPCAEKS